MRDRSLKAGLLLAGVLVSACGGEDAIERPTALFEEVPIEYPIDLWDQGVEGRTLLSVRVTEVGRIDSVVVAESSGYPAFDTAAIVGARDLRFTPARQNGKRVAVWADVPVHFSKRPRVPN